MAKKKKKRGKSEEENADEGTPKPAPSIATSLRDRLAKLELPKPGAAPKAKPSETRPSPEPPKKRAPAPPSPKVPDEKRVQRPSETLQGHDRTAYLDALAGVRPIAGRPAKRIGAVASPPVSTSAEERKREAEARARLASLVAGGVRFDVYRETDWIEGVRQGAKHSRVDALRRATVGREATLDLHGVRATVAAERVSRFVRDAERAGLRHVLIVHGKGLHSEGGGVLADIVVETLTEGAAAPFVQAFVTAPMASGGSGALVVEIGRS
jgi:DNA-nicking Smr family endonuclease